MAMAVARSTTDMGSAKEANLRGSRCSRLGQTLFVIGAIASKPAAAVLYRIVKPSMSYVRHRIAAGRTSTRQRMETIELADQHARSASPRMGINAIASDRKS